MNNSDRTDYVPDRKVFSNAKARMIFGDAVFEHMVPDGDPVAFSWKEEPNAKFYLTIDGGGSVTIRCELDSGTDTIKWDKDTLG